MLVYHTTVRSALQAVARLARSSPMMAIIHAPVARAESIALRQIDRYPVITATHVTRTHLRRAGMPAVQLVVMPPKGDETTMFLMSNVAPQPTREVWRPALDPEEPLIWRNYQLTTMPSGAITWRLSEQARGHYRHRIARLITGRGGLPKPGDKPYMLPDETAHAQLLKLADHLQHYPGVSGIRADVFELAQYSTKVWQATRKRGAYPLWPTMPYTRFNIPQTAPLAEIQNHQPYQDQEDPTDDQDQAQDDDQTCQP